MTRARVAAKIGGMDIAELSRLVENLIRVGTIHSVDHAARRARAQVGPLTTGWLRWIERRAGATTTWDPPTVGEQCIILSPSGTVENGLIIYGAPSDIIDTPSHAPETHVIRFTDGAVFEYNHATSHLAITGIKSATVDAQNTLLFKAGDSVTFDTPLVHDTGRHTTDDLLTYGNGLTGTGGSHGNTITGDFIHTNGHLTSNGVTLHTHTHNGVQPGGGNTGGPNAS